MRLHPLLSVLIRRPGLLLDHLAGYAALVREEGQASGAELARRLAAWVAALVCFLLFLLLAGVAAMLGALHGQFHWMLLLVPGTALALAIVAFLQARHRPARPAFTELRAQLDADAQALRTLGAR